MRRSLGIPASLTILIGLPLLIGIAPVSQEEPQQAAPVEAALTVAAEDAGGTVRIRVRTPGRPPKPELRATLASSDGLDTATVTPVPRGCTQTPMRQVARGTTKSGVWCLDVAGLPDHGELAGTVSGEPAGPEDFATKLALTIQRREPFEQRALWILVAGLLAGLVIALLVPALAGQIGVGRLRFLIAANEQGPPRDRIGGLRAWAADRKQAGTSAVTLRTTLQPIVSDGPAQARGARRELADLLARNPLGSHALADAAAIEAGRTDHAIADFVNSKGDAVAHPAVVFAGAVTTMATYRQTLDELEREMADKLPPDRHPPEVGAARLAWKQVRTPADVATVATALAQARAALNRALSVGIQPLVTLEQDFLAEVVAPSSFELESASLFGILLAPWALLTALCVVVAVGFAFVTVYLAGYDAKPTYGSWQDDFALFSAALGSGVAATVLGLLAPWGSKAEVA